MSFCFHRIVAFRIRAKKMSIKHCCNYFGRTVKLWLKIYYYCQNRYLKLIEGSYFFVVIIILTTSTLVRGFDLIGDGCNKSYICAIWMDGAAQYWNSPHVGRISTQVNIFGMKDFRLALIEVHFYSSRNNQ